MENNPITQTGVQALEAAMELDASKVEEIIETLHPSELVILADALGIVVTKIRNRLNDIGLMG